MQGRCIACVALLACRRVALTRLLEEKGAVNIIVGAVDVRSRRVQQQVLQVLLRIAYQPAGTRLVLDALDLLRDEDAGELRLKRLEVCFRNAADLEYALGMLRLFCVMLNGPAPDGVQREVLLELSSLDVLTTAVNHPFAIEPPFAQQLRLLRSAIERLAPSTPARLAPIEPPAALMQRAAEPAVGGSSSTLASLRAFIERDLTLARAESAMGGGGAGGTLGGGSGGLGGGGGGLGVEATDTGGFRMRAGGGARLVEQRLVEALSYGRQTDGAAFASNLQQLGALLGSDEAFGRAIRALVERGVAHSAADRHSTRLQPPVVTEAASPPPPPSEALTPPPDRKSNV